MEVQLTTGYEVVVDDALRDLAPIYWAIIGESIEGVDVYSQLISTIETGEHDDVERVIEALGGETNRELVLRIRRDPRAADEERLVFWREAYDRCTREVIFVAGQLLALKRTVDLEFLLQQLDQHWDEVRLCTTSSADGPSIR